MPAKPRLRLLIGQEARLHGGLRKPVRILSLGERRGKARSTAWPIYQESITEVHKEALRTAVLPL
jgi:hypothetical protein